MTSKVEFSDTQTGPVKLFSYTEALDDPSFDREDFDYLLEAGNVNGQRLFRHQDHWYDLDEFSLICKPGSALGMGCYVDWEGTFSEWAAIQTDSYFSAVVVRYPIVDGEPDTDYVIAANCHW